MGNCVICGKKIVCKQDYRCNPGWHPRKYCCYECENKTKIIQRKIRMEKSHNKTCLHCEGQFISKRSDTIFCSNKCKQAAYRKRKSNSEVVEVKKTFVLKIGKLHRKMLSGFSKYTIWGMYDFFDVVDMIPSNIPETFFIFRETGEILKTWYEPFNEPYEFEKCSTQLCPDSIIEMCHSLIRDYEMKTGRSFIYRAAMGYMARNSIS